MTAIGIYCLEKIFYHCGKIEAQSVNNTKGQGETDMKRFYLFALIASMLLGMPFTSTASEKTVTLLYTGNMWGKVTPCPS